MVGLRLRQGRAYYSSFSAGILAGKFLSTLDLRLKGYKKWETLAELRYQSDLAGLIIVPREFITDLASVPRLPLAYLIAGDRAPGPAVIHDWLYQHPDFEDRSLADGVINEAMAVNQPELGFEAENGVIRNLIWGGVRLGGWKAWQEHGKRGKELNPEWSASTWPKVETP